MREVDTIYSGFVTLQGVITISFGCAKRPYLNAAIERARREHVRVLRIYCQLHHVVVVLSVCILKCPRTVPIKQLDRVVIGAGQKQRLLRMHHNVSNVVGMLLNCLDFLRSVVIKDT